MKRGNLKLALLNAFKVLATFAVLASILAWIFGPQGWLLFILAMGIMAAAVWFWSGLTGEDISALLSTTDSGVVALRLTSDKSRIARVIKAAYGQDLADPNPLLSSYTTHAALAASSAQDVLRQKNSECPDVIRYADDVLRVMMQFADSLSYCASAEFAGWSEAEWAKAIDNHYKDLCAVNSLVIEGRETLQILPEDNDRQRILELVGSLGDIIRSANGF